MARYLGKLPAKPDQRTLKLATYLGKGAPPPPPEVTWNRPIPNLGWGMMGNDTHSNCTCAAAGHMIRQWTANTGKEVVLPDATILGFYDFFSDGDPHRGADMLAVLRRWRKEGVGDHKIEAFVALALRDEKELRQAVYLFGSAYIGLALPDFAVIPGVEQETIPWVVPAKGPIGDAKPDLTHGHCVPVVAYDEQQLYVVTWGCLKPMSWDFYHAYTEEAFTVLSPDWFAKAHGGKAPSGFDVTALRHDLAAVTTK